MTNKKQKPPVSLRLPEDLENYLREQAKAGFRSLTNEIVMRLEASRQSGQLGDKSPASGNS